MANYTTMKTILQAFFTAIKGKFALKDELFSRNYYDLTNKPSLGSMASKNSVALTDLPESVQTAVSSAGTAVQPSAITKMQTTENISQSISTDSTSTTKYPSVKAVKDALDALPQGMVFKGSLGTGGTITSLPTASADIVGHTYKVITAGTYASQAAKAGDMFIGTKTGSSYSWTYIPSADEPSGTVTSVNGAGATNSHITVTGGAITTSGTLTVGVASGYSIPSDTNQSTWTNDRVKTSDFSITDTEINTIANS